MASAVPEEEKQFEHRQRRAVKALAFGAVFLVALSGILTVVLRRRSAPPPETTPQVAAEPAPAPQPVPAPPAAGGVPIVPESAPPAGQLKLEIRPTAECWVSLTVDGRKIFARIMRPGEAESQLVQREAIIEVGDAGAFAFSVDGRPGKPLGATGQVRTLKLTPETAAQYVR